MKLGTDWVDSLLNTLRALYNIFHNGNMHKSLNNIWASLGMVIFYVAVNTSNVETFANSNVRSVLSMESTQSVQHFPSFVELLKEFHYPKGASTISLNFWPYVCSTTDTLVKVQHVHFMS